MITDSVYRNILRPGTQFHLSFAYWLITCDSGTMLAMTDQQSEDECSMLCMGGEL